MASALSMASSISLCGLTEVGQIVVTTVAISLSIDLTTVELISVLPILVDEGGLDGALRYNPNGDASDPGLVSRLRVSRADLLGEFP